jgi:DNA-binding MarR family transcriptional regulator
MQKRDLLQRKRTEKDQRANSVKITTIGRRALRAALPAILKSDVALLETLPARARSEFIKCLTLLSDAHSEKLTEEQNGKKKRRSRR